MLHLFVQIQGVLDVWHYTKTPSSAAKFKFRSYEGFVAVEEQDEVTSQGRQLACWDFAFLCDVFNVWGESEAFINYEPEWRVEVAFFSYHKRLCNLFL